MLASGPFVIDPVAGVGPVIDPVAIAPHQMSFHSKFHYLVGTLFFLLAPATCFCFAGYNRSSKDPALRAFRLWSFGLGFVSVTGVVLFKLALLPPASNPLLPWRGLIQRATVIPFLVWLFIFGLMMLKHARVGRASGIAGGANKFRGLGDAKDLFVILPSMNLDIRQLRTDYAHANRGKGTTRPFRRICPGPG